VTKRFALLLLAGCALVPATVLSGCKSSGNDATTIGAPAGIQTFVAPARRQSQRASPTASNKVDPGYLRYLVRLAERRQDRGLPAPAELRIAQRRERYRDTFDLLKATRSVLDTVTNPTTRYIPYLQQPTVTVTATTTSPTAQKPRDTVSTNLTFKE
jgi:hypothetical protein